MPFRTQGLTIESESEHWSVGAVLRIDARASWTDGDVAIRELNSSSPASNNEYEVNGIDSGGRGQRTRRPRSVVVSDSRAVSSLLDRRQRTGSAATTRTLFLR